MTSRERALTKLEPALAQIARLVAAGRLPARDLPVLVWHADGAGTEIANQLAACAALVTGAVPDLDFLAVLVRVDRVVDVAALPGVTRVTIAVPGGPA